MNAELVTSFAISDGTRDAAGNWTSDQVKKLLAYTSSIGGRIAAAEFFNEPNVAALGGAPKGYDAAVYGRDYRVFQTFVRGRSTERCALPVPARWAKAGCSPTSPASSPRRC